MTSSVKNSTLLKSTYFKTIQNSIKSQSKTIFYNVLLFILRPPTVFESNKFSPNNQTENQTKPLNVNFTNLTKLVIFLKQNSMYSITSFKRLNLNCTTFGKFRSLIKTKPGIVFIKLLNQPCHKANQNLI